MLHCVDGIDFLYPVYRSATLECIGIHAVAVVAAAVEMEVAVAASAAVVVDVLAVGVDAVVLAEGVEVAAAGAADSWVENC